jgi:hypothetical protein
MSDTKASNDLSIALGYSKEKETVDEGSRRGEICRRLMDLRLNNWKKISINNKEYGIRKGKRKVLSRSGKFKKCDGFLINLWGYKIVVWKEIIWEDITDTLETGVIPKHICIFITASYSRSPDFVLHPAENQIDPLLDHLETYFQQECDREQAEKKKIRDWQIEELIKYLRENPD